MSINKTKLQRTFGTVKTVTFLFNPFFHFHSFGALLVTFIYSYYIQGTRAVYENYIFNDEY